MAPWCIESIERASAAILHRHSMCTPLKRLLAYQAAHCIMGPLHLLWICASGRVSCPATFFLQVGFPAGLLTQPVLAGSGCCLQSWVCSPAEPGERSASAHLACRCCHQGCTCCRSLVGACLGVYTCWPAPRADLCRCDTGLKVWSAKWP